MWLVRLVVLLLPLSADAVVAVQSPLQLEQVLMLVVVELLVVVKLLLLFHLLLVKDVELVELLKLLVFELLRQLLLHLLYV